MRKWKKTTYISHTGVMNFDIEFVTNVYKYDATNDLVDK